MGQYNIAYFKMYVGNVILKEFNSIKTLDSYTSQYSLTELIDKLKEEKNNNDIIDNLYIIDRNGNKIFENDLIVTKFIKSDISVKNVKDDLAIYCYDKEFMESLIKFYISSYESMEYKDIILSILYEIRNDLKKMDANNMGGYKDLTKYIANVKKFINRELFYTDVKINGENIEVIIQKDKEGNSKEKYSNIRKFYVIINKILVDLFNKYNYMAQPIERKFNYETNYDMESEEFLTTEDYRKIIEDKIKKNTDLYYQNKNEEEILEEENEEIKKWVR